jgi:hypothetical protein
LYVFLIVPMRATLSAYLVLLDLISRIIYYFVRAGLQIMKLLMMQHSQTSPYFLPFRSKYSPQQPVSSTSYVLPLYRLPPLIIIIIII